MSQPPADPMQSYDLIMLLIVVATTLWGLWKGFAWQLASLTSVFSSYGVAYGLRAPVAKMIDADPPWNMFAAMLIVYILMSLASWVGFGLLSSVISGLKLSDFDRQLGGLVGAAKGALLCIVVTFFAVTLSPPAKQEAICKSRSGRYIAIALKNSGGLIPPELHAVVDPYLSTLQNKLAEHQGEAPTVDWANAWTNVTDQLQQSPANPSNYQQHQDYAPNNYQPQYPPPYDQQVDPRQYHYQPQPQYADPRYAPQPYPDPRYDPRYQQPQYPDPRYQQPQYAPPAQNPSGYGNGQQTYVDPRSSNQTGWSDPRSADARYSDPRYQAPSVDDPRYAWPTTPPTNYQTPYHEGQGPAQPNYQWR